LTVFGIYKPYFGAISKISPKSNIPHWNPHIFFILILSN